MICGKSKMPICLTVLLVLASGICSASSCQTCELDAWESAPPFEGSESMFSKYTLGLNSEAPAPMLTEMDILGKRAIVTIYSGCGSEEIASLRLLAEAVDVRVVAVLSDCWSGRLDEVRNLVGDEVTLISDPVASIVRAAYWIGNTTGYPGVTYLIDDTGKIVRRQAGSPIWLLYDDLAVPHAFAMGEDTTDISQAETILSQGDLAPIPVVEMTDLNGEAVRMDDGVPRLIYAGPSPETEKGAAILADLDALQEELPDVEFVWQLAYKSDEQMAQKWHLYNEAGIAYLHPEWYGIAYEEYMEAITAQGNSMVEEMITDLAPWQAAGWRIVPDPGNILGICWGLRFTPYVMILDSSRIVAFSHHVYPTDTSLGYTRVHPAAQGVLRQILQGVVE